ncbi:MAG: restriction endonuclease [Chloroflexota bacterium]
MSILPQSLTAGNATTIPSVLSSVQFPKSIQEVDKLSWRDFEYFTGMLLERMGHHNVRVTQSSWDYGADIVAERNGHRYAVQVKQRGALAEIPRTAIDEVIRAKDHYGCTRAMVVTTGCFTEAVRKYAAAHDCRLIDRVLLGAWVQIHSRQEPPAEGELGDTTRIAGAFSPNDTVSPPKDTTLPLFRMGDKVEHPSFGAGWVEAVAGMGDDQQVTVLFEQYGKRKFLARLAQLEKV